MTRKPDRTDQDSDGKQPGNVTKKLSKLLQGLHRRSSLTVKMVIATVMFGVFMWYSFDFMQKRNLEGLFQSHMKAELSERSREDRHSFDRYVKSHLLFARLSVLQEGFGDYVRNTGWTAGGRSEIRHRSRRPSWLKGSSDLDAVLQPRFALLLGPDGRVREIYRSRSDERLSADIIRNSRYLSAVSSDRSELTMLNNRMYLVSSKTYPASGSEALAVLMLVSPVDSHFLASAVGPMSSGRVVSLLSSGHIPQVIASSDPSSVPPGTLLETLNKEHLITGQEFPVYGATDRSIRLLSLVPMEKVHGLVTSILYTDQKLRITGLAVIIVSFVTFMFWITRRIQLLTLRIAEFSERALGVETGELRKGDQLFALEERFQVLTEEVVCARDRLKKEAEEKLLLEKRHMEMEQKEKELVFLQSITQAIGIGVLVETAGEKEAANQQMEVFAWQCGGISEFDMNGVENEELVLTDRNGKVRIFHISSPAMFNEEKIFLVRDITEIREETDALEYMAMHDSLTGLPNRALLQDRLQQAVFAGQRENRQLALLMMDLDRFKEINDTLGHHVGDLVLQKVGERLPGVLRKSDTFARLGGDEFAVVLPSTDAEHARQTALKLLKVLEDPIVLDDHSLHVGASLGIVLYPLHGEDATTLLKRADVAMYTAKNSRSGVAVYNPEHDRNSVTNLVLVSELRQAIENEDLELYYQPKMDISTGRLRGLEALVRWEHAQHGYIGPDEFISLSENTGLIKPLTSWVLKTAMHQYAYWQQSGVGVGSIISVNLSSISLLDPGFSEEIAALVGKHGIIPECLELEITESAVMADPDQALKTAMKLSECGVRLSIDDFGTGYSSLAYLKKLPLNEIKIDRSFVMNMLTDESDRMIVRSTIDLAHNLGLDVIAEGVDSEEILKKLRELGCDGAQGYYLCVPLPPDKFGQWFAGLNSGAGKGTDISTYKP